MWKAIAATFVLASPAFAQDTPAMRRIVSFSCSFVTECFETEACQPTQFDATLVLTAEGSSMTRMFARGTMITDAGDIEVGGPLINDTLSLQGLGTFPNGHLLTKTPEGDTRYTAHLPGPLTVSYQGTCQ